MSTPNDSDEFQKKLLNRFNIPLTFLDTYDVFRNISADSKYYPFIKMVYAAVHPSDGSSGRAFGTNISKSEYVALLKRIMAFKPVYISWPYPDMNVMREYIDYGVMNWMISRWDDRFISLKSAYPDLSISRSIVGNAYNQDMDGRFDAIVIAYHKLLDREWLGEQQPSRVTIIPNQTCKPVCRNLDTHLYWICNTGTVYHPDVVETHCPDYPRFFFIPRQNLEMIIDRINDIKLLDRALDCSYYERFMDHYIFDAPFPVEEIRFNPQLYSIYKDCTTVCEKWSDSELVTGNCKFDCLACEKTCY